MSDFKSITEAQLKRNLANGRWALVSEPSKSPHGDFRTAVIRITRANKTKPAGRTFIATISK